MMSLRSTRPSLFKLCLLFGLLSGCAAYGVPATSDPWQKLKYAVDLFDHRGRPLPAERLIREAVTIFHERNDEMSLAHAYRTYGFFFRSQSIDRWQHHYKTNGFIEPGATYDTRYDKSIEYFGKAATIFQAHQDDGWLSNVYFNMGLTYVAAKRSDRACEAIAKASDSHKRYLAEHPGIVVDLPYGYHSFEEYLQSLREKIPCPAVPTATLPSA